MKENLLPNESGDPIKPGQFDEITMPESIIKDEFDERVKLFNG